MERFLKGLTIAFLGGFVLVGSAFAYGDVHVRDYTRSDGTHVDSYYRTAPNSTRSDNYSSSGNINPYTGERGNKNPWF